MHIYTIILDWKGGTYIYQVRERSVDGAVQTWARELDTSPIAGFEPSLREQLSSDLEHEAATPLEGLTNAWCNDAVLGDELALIHVVKTEQQ